MSIKCIALDLDQTTLNKEGRLSPGNRAALERVIAQGVHVVIASGRSFSALPRDVTEVAGIEYAVTSNGAAVYHVPTGRCLHRFLMAPDSAEVILSLTAGEPVAYEAFVEGQGYAGADYVRDPAAYGATDRAIAYVRRTRLPVEDIAAFIRAHRHELDSLDLVVPDDGLRARLWAALETCGQPLYITSSVKRLIEISHADAGKHAGLRYVSELLQLERSEIAAFGDGDNDADMLAYAGCGIAMANASPACRAAADHITASHDENGVARGIACILGL